MDCGGNQQTVSRCLRFNIAIFNVNLESFPLAALEMQNVLIEIVSQPIYVGEMLFFRRFSPVAMGAGGARRAMRDH